MAIAKGNTITRADIYGEGEPGWATGPGLLGGSISCWRYGNLFLFSFAVCNDRNGNSPRYYKPNGWKGGTYGSDQAYLSATNINGGTPTYHFCTANGIGFAVGTTADNVWHVGNGAFRYD